MILFPLFKKGIRLSVFLLVLISLTGMAKRPPLVGSPAPEIHLTTLQGHPFSLTDYRGKVVLLTFWATWCKSCVEEFVKIHEAYEALKGDGFEVLAINVGEPQEQVASFVRQKNILFPTILDLKAKLASRYHVTGLPVSFFIDPQGIIRSRVVGELLTVENIRSMYQALKLKKK